MHGKAVSVRSAEQNVMSYKRSENMNGDTGKRTRAYSSLVRWVRKTVKPTMSHRAQHKPAHISEKRSHERACFVASHFLRFSCLQMKGCHNYTSPSVKVCEALTADGGEDNESIRVRTSRWANLRFTDVFIANAQQLTVVKNDKERKVIRARIYTNDVSICNDLIECRQLWLASHTRSSRPLGWTIH